MHQEEAQGGYGPGPMQQGGNSALPPGFDGSSGQHCASAQQMSAGQSVCRFSAGAFAIQFAAIHG